MVLNGGGQAVIIPDSNYILHYNHVDEISSIKTESYNRSLKMREKNDNDNKIIVKIIDELNYKKNLKSLKITGEKRNISEIIEYHNDDCQINFSRHPLLKNINTIIAPLRDDFNKDDQLMLSHQHDYGVKYNLNQE